MIDSKAFPGSQLLTNCLEEAYLNHLLLLSTPCTCSSSSSKGFDLGYTSCMYLSKPKHFELLNGMFREKIGNDSMTTGMQLLGRLIAMMTATKNAPGVLQYLRSYHLVNGAHISFAQQKLTGHWQTMPPLLPVLHCQHTFLCSHPDVFFEKKIETDTDFLAISGAGTCYHYTLQACRYTATDHLQSCACAFSGTLLAHDVHSTLLQQQAFDSGWATGRGQKGRLLPMQPGVQT
mmetsp:Transcript_7795/g.48338  ORF Transcript_7795/g.48338 Transcript_7795/m.48338 type:complete len:233 (+) Transcript_7795:1907-2605(+)